MRDDHTTDRLSERLKTITADLKLYVEKRVELLLLNVGEQVASWFAQSIQRVSGILLVFGGVVFLLVALAIYLGELLGSQSLGYVLVSLPLLILGLVLIYVRPRSIIERIQRQFESELLRALYRRQDGNLEDRLPVGKPAEGKKDSN